MGDRVWHSGTPGSTIIYPSYKKRDKRDYDGRQGLAIFGGPVRTSGSQAHNKGDTPGSIFVLLSKFRTPTVSCLGNWIGVCLLGMSTMPPQLKTLEL